MLTRRALTHNLYRQISEANREWCIQLISCYSNFILYYTTCIQITKWPSAFLYHNTLLTSTPTIGPNLTKPAEHHTHFVRHSCTKEKNTGKYYTCAFMFTTFKSNSTQQQLNAETKHIYRTNRETEISLI